MTEETTEKIKYPRVYHLPWSNISKGDRQLKSDSVFNQKEVVVTEKVDGGCVTVAQNYWHTRSLTPMKHSSTHYIAQLQSLLCYKLDPRYRIVGENMYMQHVIEYDLLPDYFLVHSIWIGHYCLSYYDTMKIIKKLDLIHVPVIYTGMYDVKAIQAAVDMKMKKSAYSTHENSLEGYVIRNTEGFNLESYSENVGKYVFPQYRDAHNAQGEEWLYKVGKPNILVRY